VNESALDGSLTSLIMLAFNPAVHAGDAFLDNTPEKNPVSWGSFTTGIAAWVGLSHNGVGVSGSVYRDMPSRPAPGHMHALRLPGTIDSVTRDVRNTLDCLGGLIVLFPLFAQFDQPTLQVGTRTPNFDTEPKLAEWVLNLLGTLVDRRSAANQAFLHQQHGWPMVTFFLKRVSPQHLTKACLKAIRRLTGCGKWSESKSSNDSSSSASSILGAGLSGSGSGGGGADGASYSFSSSAVHHLLGHWSLWVFADHEVQLLMSAELKEMVSHEELHTSLPLQSVLDGMALHFWYLPPNSLIEDYEVSYDFQDSVAAREKEIPSPTSATPVSSHLPEEILEPASAMKRSSSSTSLSSAAPTPTPVKKRAPSWNFGGSVSGGPTPQVASNTQTRRRAKPSKKAVKRLVKPLLDLESIHPSTKKMDGSRAPREVVNKVRANLWAAMDVKLTKTKITQVDICAILGFCLRSDDDTSKEEGLEVLLKHTRAAEQSTALVSALGLMSSDLSSGVGVEGIGDGALLLLELLRPCYSRKIRIYSFCLIVRALGVLFGRMEEDDESNNQRRQSVISPDSPLFTLFGSDAPTRRLILSWASRQLAQPQKSISNSGEGGSISNTTSNSANGDIGAVSDGFIEVLVGGDGGSLGARWAGIPGNDADILLVQENVVVPESIGALCVHLSRKELGSSKRGSLLQRVKDLSAHETNRDALLAEPNWQASLLFVACSALQFAELEEQQTPGGADAAREVRSCEVAVSLVCGLVFHALTRWYRQVNATDQNGVGQATGGGGTATAATEIDPRIVNINLLAGVDEAFEPPAEKALPVGVGLELDEVLATLQVLARPPEHRLTSGAARPSNAEHFSISEVQVGGAIASRVGFDILMGVVQRLRQEMELLASRRGQWFDNSQLNSPAAWDSTVAVVWHTVRSALSFLVLPPDAANSRTRFERVVAKGKLPQPLSESMEEYETSEPEVTVVPDFENMTVAEKLETVADVSVEPTLPEAPVWRMMDCEEDSEEAKTSAVQAAWRVVEALLDVISTVDVEQENEDRPTVLKSMSSIPTSASGEGMATFFSEVRHCFLGGLLPRLPSADGIDNQLNAAQTSTPLNASPSRTARRKRTASSAEVMESEEEKAAWLSEKPLHIVEPSHTLIPWAFCRVLLNTAVLGARSDSNESGWREVAPVMSLGALKNATEKTGAVETVAISALNKLSLMLSLLDRARVEGIESEVVVVMASLVAAIRTTTKPATDVWVANALKLVQGIASNPRYTNELRDLFTKRHSVDGTTTAHSARMRSISHASSSKLVFGVMCEALGVKDKKEEDWSIWDDGVDQELSAAILDESVVAELLHGPGQASYEAALAEEEKRVVRRKATRLALDVRVTQAAKRVRQEEAGRLVEVLAEGERDRRHSEQEWGKILEGLASERGPWGVNNGENGRRVYWMLNDSEDHMRRRQKLSRNPLGSAHTGAAQNSKESREPKESAASARRKTRVNESRLWKDLRYTFK